MAGRYDKNPFDEEEVNPFAVSDPSHPWLRAQIWFFRGLLSALLCPPRLFPLRIDGGWRLRPRIGVSRGSVWFLGRSRVLSGLSTSRQEVNGAYSGLTWALVSSLCPRTGGGRWRYRAFFTWGALSLRFFLVKRVAVSVCWLGSAVVDQMFPDLQFDG